MTVAKCAPEPVSQKPLDHSVFRPHWIKVQTKIAKREEFCEANVAASTAADSQNATNPVLPDSYYWLALVGAAPQRPVGLD